MRRLSEIAVHRAVQVLLAPFAAAGYAGFVAKLVAHSRRTGAAGTVLASLYTRYMQHRLSVRPDAPAERLMLAMPSVSPLGLRLVTAPTLASHRLTGYVPPIYRYPYPGEPPMAHQPAARTTFYDQALARHLPHAEQLVILGAGFDTRAYRLPADARVRSFEVDQPATQAFKREVLERAGIDTSRVTFLTADFERDDWLEKLVEAGFDARKRSFFTWESVTMYLERGAVEATLRRIAGMAPGTAVAFDYVASELITSRSLFMRYARAVMRMTGEPWKFGLGNAPPARERVAEFLASCGLALEEHRSFGPETDRERPPAGFAIAVVPPPDPLARRSDG
jgi:methyltransferase (TIGR00027 family)